MKGFRKISAFICVIALVVTSITCYLKTYVSAVSYETLTYTKLSDNISYSKLSDGIEGMSPTSPELLDAGTTLLFAFSADNQNVKVAINGTNVTAGDDRVIEIGNSIAKVNPQKFDDNAYTLISISSSKGISEYVIKRGNPTSGGEIPTSNQGQTETTKEGQTTAPIETSTQAAAATLPKQLIGLDIATKSGESSIDNAVMFAWADANNPNNVDGYDSSVTSVVIYIYKDGALVTKIGNATNGGVVGGLSAGTYTAQAANVNSKGEGPLSETKSFTITGETLKYTYPVNCIGPKTPNGLNIITGNPEVPENDPAQQDNKLGVAWAPSSNASVPAYDMSVVGYNVYIFDAETGKPYRRAYVEGVSTNTVLLESVSSGTYLVFLSAVNAAGEESALAAPSFGQSSKVTVKGVKIDNAQDFDTPDQPTLPFGLTIITEGIQYGFTVAWSSEASFEGQKLNLFVDGVCIKSGINGAESSYYENRLAAGTYTVEVKSQYTDTNVESFGLSKTITIAADPGVEAKTPAQLADSSYKPYEKEDITTTVSPIETSEDNTTNGKDETTTGKDETTKDMTTTGNDVHPTTGSVKPTQNPTSVIKPATVKVVKSSVKKAVKKKNAKKVKIKIKKVTKVTGYKIQFSKKKNFKKVLLSKKVKKISFNIISTKLKKANKLYVRVKVYRVVSGKTYESGWSNAKKVKITK